MDKNVTNVVEKYLERAAVGFKKYGCTTERQDIDLVGWLKHLQEEMMDATVYIERAMTEFAKENIEVQHKVFDNMVKVLQK